MTEPPPAPTASGTPHWTAIDWQPRIRNCLVNNRQLRYVDYGSGPVLVLLHGMAASWQWWLENIPALAERHRVIAIDLPGFGHSESLSVPPEMATYARVVLDLLTQLDVESAVVVGHSMAGLVALEMAAADPHRTRELILVDAGGVPMTERRLAVILVFLRLAVAILQRGVVRRVLAQRESVRRIALRAGFRDPRTISAQLAAQIMPIFAGPGSVAAVATAGRAVRNMTPADVGCPVLLIWGEFDLMVPLSCAQDMHDRLADSRLVVIGGVGHSPMIEAPDEFNRAVIEFVTRQR